MHIKTLQLVSQQQKVLIAMLGLFVDHEMMVSNVSNQTLFTRNSTSGMLFVKGS